jgi:hypothetical protein
LAEFANIRVSFAAIRVEIICVKTIQRGPHFRRLPA